VIRKLFAVLRPGRVIAHPLAAKKGPARLGGAPRHSGDAGLGRANEILPGLPSSTGKSDDISTLGDVLPNFG